MTFRELLERYKTGTATPEEQALVETELEKNEAISDYLAEGFSIPTGENAPPRRESRRVKKTVNRRLMRVVALSVAIVFALLLGTRFVLSPLFAATRYNPTGKTVGQQSVADIDFDLSTLYELVYPGFSVRSVDAEDLQFGRYRLHFQQVDSFTGETESRSRELSAKWDGAGWWVDPYFELTGLSPRDEKDGGLWLAEQYTAASIAELRQLPESAYISAWVSFPKELTPEELTLLSSAFEKKYQTKDQSRSDISFRWAAVRTTESRDLPLPRMGFATAGQTYGHVDAPNPVQYPLFNLSTLHSNQEENPLSITDFPEPNGFEKYKAAGFELHFTSMLRYLADRPAATNALVHSSQDPQSDFAGALSYVEENGVRIYGALVYGKPCALLDLCDSGSAQYVSLVKVLPSRYSAAYGAR